MSVDFTHVPTANRRLPQPSSPAWSDRETAPSLERAFRHLIVDGPGGLLTNMDIAAETAASTSRVGIVLTHWSGVIHPLVAAAQIARLDRLSEGRLSLRFLLGPDGQHDRGEQERSHVESLRQTDEYLVLLKRLWANDKPFDHEGPHYSLHDGFVAEKGPKGADISVRMGGVSGVALDVAGRHATVFELAASSHTEIRGLMQRVSAAALRYGRAGKLRFSLPVHLDFGRGEPASPGYIGLSGSPVRIARALLSYATLGVSEFLVTGLHDRDALDVFVSDVAPIFDRTVPIGSVRRDAALAGRAGRHPWAN